jgi:membrane protease YdiL (CAAX protease family)
MTASLERFTRLEDAGKDFPFYNGAPSPISAGQWLFVLAMVTVAFLLLALPIDWPGGSFGPFIPALLFPVLPLAALAWVAPGHWRSIFGRVGGREVKLMLGFALLNIVVSLSVGAALRAFAEVTPNAATAQLGALDTAGQVAFFAKTAPQLFGEELITILPFLALLQWLVGSLGVGRRRAIIVAWLVSSLVFGLLHLPTYDWNVVQCVLVIGTARLVLTLPWIMTKNIWVSTGAHIVNDWSLFGLALLGAGLATTT